MPSNNTPYTFQELMEGRRNAQASNTPEGRAAVIAIDKDILAMRVAADKASSARMSAAYQGAQVPFATAANATLRGGLNAARYLGIPGAEEYQNRQKQAESSREAERVFAQHSNPAAYTTGNVVGTTAAVAPAVELLGLGIAGAGGKAMQTAYPTVANAFTKVGNLVRGGGFGSARTEAQTAALAEKSFAARNATRTAELAARSGGGAVAGATAGGTGAVLNNQDVGEGIASGAVFGAGLPVVGAVLRNITGKGIDLFRMPQLKAAEIIRKSLGENVDKARAAFAAMSPDDKRLAQQVLTGAKVDADTYAALGLSAGKKLPEKTREVQEAVDTARNKTLTQAAGSEDATQARIAADLGRKNVEATFGPTRNNILAEQQGVNTKITGLQQQGAAATQQAADQSALARRMAFGADRAEMGVGQADDLGDVFNPAAVNQQRGLAGAMGQRSETAATNAIDLRQSAEDIQDQIAQMALQGEKPTEAGPMVTALRTKANTPGIRASKEQVAVLSDLADNIESLAARNGGLIHPQDLYQLRKTSANDVVGRLMAGAQPSSGVKQATAGHVIDFKNTVDNALGPAWKDVMARSSAAYENVTRQKLAAHLSDLARDKPDEFVEVMRGRKPEVVEGIMGEGKFNIRDIASSDPAMFAPFDQAAKQLATEARTGILAKSGSSKANDLMYSNRVNPLYRGATNVMGMLTGGPMRMGLQGAEMMGSSYLAPPVNAALGESFLSGQNSLNAMNQYPMSSYMAQPMSRLSPQSRFAISQALPASLNYMGNNLDSSPKGY